MDTKERILCATLELASQKGLGNVSLSQIAQLVGIRKATLYSHYDSKEEIIRSLYHYLREKAVAQNGSIAVDYNQFIQGKSCRQILSEVVASYIAMNNQSQLSMFYRFIVSERMLSQEAAHIMMLETEKMISASKQLFHAMKTQGILTVEDVDTAAVAFAMSIHSILDYVGDKQLCTAERDESFLEAYLDKFSQWLSKKNT